MKKIWTILVYISLILGTCLFATNDLKAYVVIDSTLGQLKPSADVKASLLSNWGNQFGTSYNSGSDFQTYTSLGQFWYGGAVSGEYLDVVADYYVGFETIGPDTIYNYLPYAQNTLTADNLRCGIGDFRNGYDNTYKPSVTDFKVELSSRTYENIKQYQYHIKFNYHQRINPVVKSSTNLNCYFSVGTDKFFLQLKVNNGTLRIGYYNSVFNWSVSDDPNSKLLTEINNNQKVTNEKLDNINNNQKDTNKKLDDVNKNLTDDTPPDTTGLGNASGWLPAGPVDSILTLPLNVLNTIYTNLSKSCTAVTLPLPFVESSISLPCGDIIYSRIDGLSVLLNTIGLVLGSFLLYSYFIYLYNWVDKKVSLIESDREKWGAV